VNILGHRSGVLVPVPCAAYIAGGINGFGGESEFTESFQLIQTTKPSTNNQRVNFVGGHAANQVM
jgi:hypothetical protein